jgi:DNA-binding transcriptional ArsR family regulator
VVRESPAVVADVLRGEADRDDEPVSNSIHLYLYKTQLHAEHVHAFDVLGDPVRRRILELLADGEQSAGEIGSVVQREFGISQPGISQHLRVLRDNGFARVRPEGARRLYAVEPGPLQDINQWLERFRRTWDRHLDALATELTRGKRERHLRENHPAPPGEDPVADPEEEA